VDLDGDSPLAPGALGEADVVRMAVRQDDRLDVVKHSAHRREFGRQVRPVAGHRGVDDRDLAPLPQEVAVHEAVAEAMDAVRDLHGGIVGLGSPSRTHENAQRNRRSLDVPVNTSTDRLT
jgi:hypothetical protein